MDLIIIRDLEVSYQIGVPAAERASAQRLLLTLELERDLSSAAWSDELTQTVDYSAVCQRLVHFGQNRHWKLIETLAVDIAEMVRNDFAVSRVTVEVKKFIIPEARYIAVRITRPPAG